MTTDQMDTDDFIRLLAEKHGLRIPGHLKWAENGYITPWKYYGRHMEYPHAYDLCERAFTRQLDAMPASELDKKIEGREPAFLRYDEAKQRGDSAAAIKALYDAMEAK